MLLRAPLELDEGAQSRPYSERANRLAFDSITAITTLRSAIPFVSFVRFVIVVLLSLTQNTYLPFDS